MYLRWISIIGGVLLLMGGMPAAAQSSADAFFHDAARQYVDGNVQAARQSVAQGLEVAPSDPRLLALREKLSEQDKRQGGGRSSQQGPQNRQQDQQSRGEGSQDEQSGESGEETRPQADQSSDQQSSQRGDAGSSGRTGPPAQDRNQEARAGTRQRPNALSQVQAARLLQALENQEMKLLREVQRRGGSDESAEKDW